MKRVSLIGAGPGAADLITVRGLQRLQEAEVVIYDALGCQELLQYCPQAIQINVGKRCGAHSSSQVFINQILVDHAKRYNRVVRLKGGDPMMFGRADEELSALEENGLEYEVVPGITAALAAASTLKTPLTKRGVARGVTFTTQASYDESSLSHQKPSGDTMVYYMGRNQAEKIARGLLAQGYATTLPVRVIEGISTNDERAMLTTLAELAAFGLQQWANSDQPCLIMMGNAIAQRDTQSNTDLISQVA